MVAIEHVRWKARERRHRADLVVDTFEECHTQRPPVNLARVPVPSEYFRSKIGEGAGLAMKELTRPKIRRDVLYQSVLSVSVVISKPYKIGQMHMTL